MRFALTIARTKFHRDGVPVGQSRIMETEKKKYLGGRYLVHNSAKRHRRVSQHLEVQTEGVKGCKPLERQKGKGAPRGNREGRAQTRERLTRTPP